MYASEALEVKDQVKSNRKGPASWCIRVWFVLCFSEVGVIICLFPEVAGSKQTYQETIKKWVMYVFHQFIYCYYAIFPGCPD